MGRRSDCWPSEQKDEGRWSVFLDRVFCWMYGHTWWYGGTLTKLEEAKTVRWCCVCPRIEDRIQDAWVVRR